MRITRVYTRAGDRGTTRVVGGAEVPKDDQRIEAYGTVDELNSVLGLARAFLADAAADARQRLDPLLGTIQDDLFNVGTELATPVDARWPQMFRVGDPEVTALENEIDALNGELEPLKEFVLPGGGKVAAFLHQARTVCRRAERVSVGLAEVQPDVLDGAVRYLNRLSDLLFVAARWAARATGHDEVLWRNPAKKA